MPTFKAIELDPVSKRRTGRLHALAATTRQGAVDELLALLDVDIAAVRIDPTRTLIQLPTELWTIVGTSLAPEEEATAALRRAGAKHKRVR